MSQSEGNTTDSFLKNRLHDYNRPVPSHLWKKIQNDLNAGNNKRPSLFWLYLLLPLLFTAGYFTGVYNKMENGDFTASSPSVTIKIDSISTISESVKTGQHSLNNRNIQSTETNVLLDEMRAMNNRMALMEAEIKRLSQNKNYYPSNVLYKPNTRDRTISSPFKKEENYNNNKSSNMDVRSISAVKGIQSNADKGLHDLDSQKDNDHLYTKKDESNRSDDSKFGKPNKGTTDRNKSDKALLEYEPIYSVGNKSSITKDDSGQSKDGITQPNSNNINNKVVSENYNLSSQKDHSTQMTNIELPIESQSDRINTKTTLVKVDTTPNEGEGKVLRIN